MDELLRFHHDWAYGSIAINFFAGFWMLAGLKIKSLARKSYFFYPVYIGWSAIAIQGLLGISLYMSGHGVENDEGFHYFYGFLTLIVAGLLWSYARTFGRQKTLILGLSSLFLAGLSLRAALVVLL